MTAASALPRAATAALAALALGACATLGRAPGVGTVVAESPEVVVATAGPDDTTAGLAQRFLGDAALAWMIEDYNDIRALSVGQTVVIPRRPWNPSGVYSTGYQLVPVLTYHDIGPQARGRLVMATATFAEQMQYLAANGYRVIGLGELYEFLQLRRQLPRRAVVLTFDDGYRSFLRHAYPVLKAHRFPATLFVYTDYVGTGRNALDWDDLARLSGEGFQVEGHTKTHADLRRQAGESEAEHARRLRVELESSQRVFQQRLGRPARFLAYPYGAADDLVLTRTRELGFLAGLGVYREGNASFVPLFRIRRSQVYADMTLDDFVKNLNTFAAEPIGGVPSSAPARRRGVAAAPRVRAEALERDGALRAALEACRIALALEPDDPALRAQRARLEARIEREVGEHLQEARAALGRRAHLEARRHLLTALALDPANVSAFESLRRDVKEVRFVTHTIRAGESLGSIAQRYYGDRSRSEVIWELNQLPRNPRLIVGASLRVPEIPGVPFLRTPPEGGPPEPARPASPREDVAPERDPLLDEAREALERRDFAEALADVDRVLAGNPRSADGVALKKSILYALGKTRLAEKRYDESYRALTQLSALAASYEDAADLAGQARTGLVRQRYNEGLRLYREERLEQAIAQWKSVLDLDPHHPSARKNIEQAELILRKLDERARR